MLFVLDNYDSFTYNLVQRFGEIDPSIHVVVARNDQTSLDEIAAAKPDRIVISPGPCTPAEAGLSMAVIERFGPHVPVLGVCLGHQGLAHVRGGSVVRAAEIVHGRISRVFHRGDGLFTGIPQGFRAVRYHSLVVEPALPAELEAVAWADDGTLMAIRDRHRRAWGVQFHPESILTEHGHALLKNFLES